MAISFTFVKFDYYLALSSIIDAWRSVFSNSKKTEDTITLPVITMVRKVEIFMILILNFRNIGTPTTRMTLVSSGKMLAWRCELETTEEFLLDW